MSFIELLFNLLGITCERNSCSTIHMLLGEEVDWISDRIERVLLPILFVPNFLHSSV